jgi:hypothetical protein
MAVSEDVLRLVHTVEQLPREHQDKFFKIVDLLSLVPIGVQDKTQQMLRELLARGAASKRERVMAGVDGLIEYLQRNAAVELRRSTGEYDYAASSKRLS